MASNDKKHVNLDHARKEHQIAVMKRIVEDDKCPFCMENLMQYHTNPILSESDHWILTENFAPYDGVKKHYLLISKKHLVFFWELSNEAWVELFDLCNQVLVQDAMLGGTIVMRWGDTEHTSATVTHLHAQLVTGASKEEGGEEIITAIGYKPQKARKVKSWQKHYSSSGYFTLTEDSNPYNFGGANEFFCLTPTNDTCAVFGELSREAKIDIFNKFNTLRSIRGHQAGAFIMRFGDQAYSGSAVPYFEVELITGVSREEGGEKILTALGYKVPKEVPSS